MRHILLIMAMLLAAISAFCAEPADSIGDEDPYFLLMGEADKAVAKQDWHEAAARLRDALAIRPEHPSNVILLTNLATVYTYMGSDSLALDTFDKAVDEQPDLRSAVMGRARLLMRMGRDREAYEDLSHMIDLDSLATEPRYYRGMMNLYGGQAAKAEADFNVLARVVPKSRDTAIALGTLYALTNREQKAIPYLRKLVESDPQPEFYSQLAGCQLALEYLNDAAETIGEGLEKFPLDPELYYYRAWLNRDRFLLDEAKADAKTAVQLGASPAKVADLFK